MAGLSNQEYDERKQFLEDVKRLVKSEQESLFRILKNEKGEFSENSNGIFFDVTKLSQEQFAKLQEYMIFVNKNRNDLAIRDEEQKKAFQMLEETTDD